MQSHLGDDKDGNIYEINRNTPEFRDGIPVQGAPPVRGDLEHTYADPRDLPPNRPGHVGQPVAASSDIAYAEGSNTQMVNGDPRLPPNEMHGKKWAGSGKVVSASELDAMDRRHGTSVQPLAPGAYQLQDGNVLLVFEDGRREAIPPHEYQRRVSVTQQQQAPQQQGLVGRLLGAIRGK